MRFKSTIKRWLGRIVRRLAPRGRQLSPLLWGLDTTPDGELRLGTHALSTLAKEYGTPLHVHDASALRSNFGALAELDVFYSYKTHPLPAVLQSLHALGAGAEVISELELDLALRMGVPAERIIYNGPAKSDRSLHTAIEQGILLLNLNHAEELPRIVRIARGLKRRVRLGIRVTTRAGWSAQFGTAIDGGAALALFREALATPEIELVGLHSHRGALIDNEPDLLAFLNELLAFAALLEERLGWSPEILDVGGSLALSTVGPTSWLQGRLARTFGVEIGAPEQDTCLTPATYASIVKATVSAHYRDRPALMPHVVIEPGRALTGSTQMLVTRVVSTRGSTDGSALAILDAGVNIASILRHERHQILTVRQRSAEACRRYRLVGPICQPGDVLVDAIWLPVLQAGDLLVILDSGAYFEPDSTIFSFPRPGTVVVDGSDVTLARRAETLQDVLMRDAAGASLQSDRAG